MEVLRPFYNSAPAFSPLNAELAQRAIDGMYWAEAVGMRTISIETRAYFLIDMQIDPPFDLDLSDESDQLRRIYRFVDPMDKWVLMFRNRLGGSLRCKPWHYNGAYIHCAFYWFVYMPVELIATGKSVDARATEPMRSLMLAGNYPAGIDKDKKLILITA
ncbi:MAG: hypothetical protein PHC70_01260 [Patescibacteria group bacterium]|nr:hypothetical protein [Patescibacteria group bacterium]